MTDIESPEDRRLFDRFSARFPAKFKDTRDDYGTKVFLHNASADGAHITTREKLYLNDSVALEVKLPDNDNPMNIRGEVVWTRKGIQDIWDVGIKFHKVRLMHTSRLFKFFEKANS